VPVGDPVPQVHDELAVQIDGEGRAQLLALGEMPFEHLSYAGEPRIAVHQTSAEKGSAYLVHEPNNWGRFGPDDQRGTLNLLTPDVVLAALRAATTGEVLSLSMPIRGATSSPAPTTVPHLRGRPLPQHFMSVDGGDYAAGARPIGEGLYVADDALIVTPHGTTTHMDALCHMWSGDQVYNGHPAARVRSYGATRCGIEHVGGVVARGVLFDVPRRLGLDHLPADFRIPAAAWR
jgi:hypothetical protein